MFNIKAAVSRLEFAPDTEQMEVVDISMGRFVFPPLPEGEVSLQALQDAIEGAGYEIEVARLTVVGTVTAEGLLEVAETGQSFVLRAAEGEELPPPGARVRMEGVWSVDGDREALRIESRSVVGEESASER